jgi:hypothetical protein
VQEAGGGVNDEPVQEVCHNQEEVGAQRVSLSQPTAAMDPRTQHAVQENDSPPCRKEGDHHSPLLTPKSSRTEDRMKRPSFHVIECLPEVGVQHLLQH